MQSELQELELIIPCSKIGFGLGCADEIMEKCRFFF